ncbi:SNARE associated Golgi protein [Verrucomicrobiia bacterium DG1235]|nr:SNARE associated Golgi protein [Verrucomicrobiae bacterium DG1235]
MKSKTKLAVFYVVALFASHLWLAFSGDQAADSGKEVELGESDRLFVLLGEAGGFDNALEPLSNELGRIENTDVWVPDFGAGAFELDDVEGFLAMNASPSIQLVGNRYGCVEALLLADRLGERISSVTLVAPVISTRFELLGDERLNGALKAFQLAWFWALENGVPHFGLTDLLPYNLRSSRRVFDADQDAASQVFESLDTRVFVAYGADGGIAANGALEAFRAVRPRVGDIRYPGTDDEVLSEHSAELAKSLLSLSQVGRVVGTGRVAESPRFEDFSGIRLSAWWAGFLLAVATFASEDFACIGGGLLAASGSVGLTPAILGCMLGIFFGDLGIYFIGRIFGTAAVDLPVLRRIVSPKALRRSSDWFAKRGVALVVLTRFFPGSRVPTYFAAGVVKVDWIRFTLALLLASAIWTPILVLCSFFLGEVFLELFESLGAGGWLGIVAFILCFAFGVRLFAKLASWKGRRLLYSSWRRLTGWEFWPIWAVYAPVVFQILWLAIRHRSVSLPFSVNSCMPASGLVYESKIQILEHLERAGVPIARFEAIRLELSSEEKLARLEAFMERVNLSYPVALKPDVGQRGQGVVIAKTVEEAKAFFEKQEEDTIAQEYIGGSEYGVFYHRFLSEESGVVSSITDKRTVFVIGDGRSNLETLILRDERAVCMAAYFLSEYESELERVLSDGEKFMLASIGTHSRGAVFLDGAELITPELSEAVDRFSRDVEGFHFGRYDLRVPSPEHLKRGEGIRVIELNGITSEPTNMYDPKHGPFFGWASLMRQWRLIFALAKENRLSGHEPVSKRYVLRLAISYLRGVPSRDLF